jgi:hypothetical protein
MAVMIDIPGIGQVEAQNAASEATLKALLAVMSSGGGRGGAAGGGAAGGGAAGSRAGGGGAGGGGAGGGGALGLASAAVSKSFKGVGFMAGMAVVGIGKLKDTAIQTAGAYVKFSDTVTGAVESLSRLDGSATGAAQMFSSIPIFGKLFSAVAGAADDVTKSFVAVSQTGATFGGSISNFATAASQAGMSMAEFGSMIQKNSNAMTAFGTTTEGGASNFARVSKQLRSTSSELYALGFSTQDINQGLASYGALMKAQGLQGKKSNAELAQGAKSYLKEMDLLAKVTGQSRADIEKSREAMAKDAQFQASMQGLGEGVRNSFMSVTDGLQDTGLKNFAKDIMATGTATTEENQKLMAMMPQSAAMLQRMNQKMQRGEAVTLEERNALNNMMKSEGGKNLQNIKSAAAANSELAGLTNSLAATQSLNKDSLLEATEEQKKAAAETDKMNQKMQQFQAAIAEVGNKFKMLLANSGILDYLISAFGTVANLAEKYLVPAFNLVVSVAMKIWEGMSLLLAPVIDYLSEKFGASGLGGTVEFIDGIMNAVFPVLGGLVRGAILAFDGLYNGVMQIIQPLKELMSNIFGVSESTGGFGEILIKVGAFVGEAFQVLGTAVGVLIKVFDFMFTPIIKAVVAILGGMWTVVKDVINGLAKFMDIIQDVGSFFDDLMDQILFAIGKLTKGLAGISEKEYAERKEQSDQRKKDRAEERALRKTNNDELTKAQITGLKKDEAQFKEKKLTHDRLTTGAKKEAEAKEAAVKAQEKLLDYSAGPEELLKQFSGKQGGAVEIGIKKQEIGKEKDAANKELTEAKTTAEKKAAIEKVEAAEKKLEALTKAEKAQKEAEKQQIIKDFEKSGNEKADAEAKEKAAVPAPAKPQPTTAPTDKPAVPASAKPQPTTQTDAGKKALEADAEKKKQEADAKAKTDAEAKAKEEAAAKEKQEQDKKSQESPSTLLAELNTKMAQLIKLQAQTTTNTYENVMATKGLNKNLYKA